ncbi:hypothetical protein C3400_10390 [Klebsiella oxytoca]|nr:hypothetical protein C2U44_21650 [Klebsiella oxytoca]MBX4648330.1 hypothetical protein [Klebsiella michiganensis]AUV99747.1 hypothetical protein C2U46_19845 [Klebsiella oxytoca]PNO44272.1 hypothetical protein MC52_017805 [Klebsiella michiganensis]PNO50775.1 hypothetical protein MC52_001125 [Klebsiella michiganensis]
MDVVVFLYPSSFNLHFCWLPLLTPVTYGCKLLGMNEGHPCPSPKAASGCSNSFLTNLSLSCRLNATRNPLDIELEIELNT